LRHNVVDSLVWYKRQNIFITVKYADIIIVTTQNRHKELVTTFWTRTTC